MEPMEPITITVTDRQTIRTSDSSINVIVSKGYMGEKRVLIKEVTSNRGWAGDCRHEASYRRANSIHSRFICKPLLVIPSPSNQNTKIYITEGYDGTAREYFRERNLTDAGGLLSDDFARILLQWLKGLRDIFSTRNPHGRLGDAHSLVVSKGQGRLTNLYGGYLGDPSWQRPDLEAFSVAIENLFVDSDLEVPHRLGLLLLFLRSSYNVDNLLENIHSHPAFLTSIERLQYVDNGYALIHNDKTAAIAVSKVFKMIYPASGFKWTPTVANHTNGDLVGIFNHQWQVYSFDDTPGDFLRFYRKCVHHYPKQRDWEEWAEHLEPLLEDIWPEFIDRLHEVFVRSFVFVGTKNR